MLKQDQVQTYFRRSAVPFDSLYAEDEMSPLNRYLNRRFRSDIYRRYLLTLDHVKRVGAKSVLDVGCGSGRYGQALAEVGVEHYLGIDFSPEMIDLARQNTAQIRHEGKRFDFKVEDFMDFETDETFDVVVAMGVLDYVADPPAMLRKMREVANTSAVVSFPSISAWRTPIRKARYRIKQCPVYFYDRPGIEDLTEKAGFAGSETTKIPGAGMDYVVAFFKDASLLR